MTRTILFPAMAICLAIASPLSAQQNAPRAACAGPQHKQFDYWIGEWNVFNAQGQQIGNSKVTSISGGCGVLEEWHTAGNAGGKSLNFFDAADNQWHQVWVGGDGTVLRIAGGLQNGAMTMAGPDRQTPRGKVRDRITWTPAADGTLEQRWDLSADGGATWTTAFVGTYRRKT